jgi:acid phosphatase (class A)
MKILNHSARFLRPVFFAALFAAVSVVAFAGETALNYLQPGHPEVITLLAPPPLAGSVEQETDLDTVRRAVHAATSDEVAAAFSERSFSVFNFTEPVGAFFIPANLPKTTAFFQRVQQDARATTEVGKNFWKRPRPFVMDPTLAAGPLERNFSYPSGHSTETMVLALVLADLLPEKRDALIAHARTMGWHRVQIARHYPTDIYAGRVLAQAIVRELKKSDAFEKELAGVKTEIEAVQAAAKN